MRKRAQGTEHEYTLYCSKMDELSIDPHNVAIDILRNSNLHCKGEFTINQSRVYYDVGHLELSTCEVSSPYDLVIWEKAGEKIVDWLRKKVEEKYCGKNMYVWAYKNNTSPDGTSYGSHENYCVARKVKFPERFLNELVPHLTTRMIYCGAGDIIDGKYVLSPNTYLTSHIISDNTMHGTGVLNTRDEPHSDEKYRRLHLLIGDALMNENSIFLRNFTTSAILQLMEDEKLNDVPKLEKPLEDMWNNVELRNPDKWKIELKNGTTTPIDIQRYYLAKAESIIENENERKAIKIWEEVLNKLEKKDNSLSKKIEWLDRYKAITEYNGDDMKVCKRYSEIGVERSIFYDRQRKGIVDRLLSDDDILNAIYNPPNDTRANARRKICEKLEAQGIDWSYVIVDGRKLSLTEPLSPDWSD
ncbi:MAG: proteasome accessory factor PafA2 family protein [Candidatus Thermoplasmatota archaeon]